jgi:hypothetical protein
VGLDVIGDCLTEVNVTSPTCFQEITSRPALTWPAMFVDALEAAVKVALEANHGRRQPWQLAGSAPTKTIAALAGRSMGAPSWANTLSSPGLDAVQFSLVVSGSVTTMASRSVWAVEFGQINLEVVVAQLHFAKRVARRTR